MPEQLNTIFNNLRSSRYYDYSLAEVDDICEYAFVKFFLPLLDYGTMSIQYENHDDIISFDDINANGVHYRRFLPFSLMTVQLKNTFDGKLRAEGALAMNVINLNRVDGCTREKVFEELSCQLKDYFHVHNNADHWDDMLHIIRWSAYNGGFNLLKFLDKLVEDEEVAGSIVVSIEQMLHELNPSAQLPASKFEL